MREMTLTEEQENIDFEKLKAFNEKADIFSNVGKMRNKNYYDASATTNDGERKFIIELKNKNVHYEFGTITAKSLKTDDIWILSHKYSDMVIEALTGKTTPLYINFTANGYTIIFNLLKLTDIVRHKRTQFYSTAMEKMEEDRPYGLKLKDAAIYNPKGKLIKKPHEQPTE